MKQGWLWAVLLGLAVTVAQADEYDHELVKRLQNAGEIVALEQITRDVHQRHSGRIIEVEFEREDGRYVYEIELLDEQGNVREFYYDAASGRFLKEE